MRILSFIAVVLLSLNGVHAQKFFRSSGWTVFTSGNYIAGDEAVEQVIYDATGGSYSELHQTFGYDLMSYDYGLRYNVLEFGEDMSLSISSNPELSISFFSTGAFLGARGDLSLGFNIGNGATYAGIKDKGFVIKAGLDFSQYPLIQGSVDEENQVPFLVGPMIQVGYRYWNNSNTLREILFTYSTANFDKTTPYEVYSDQVNDFVTLNIQNTYRMNRFALHFRGFLNF